MKSPLLASFIFNAITTATTSLRECAEQHHALCGDNEYKSGSSCNAGTSRTDVKRNGALLWDDCSEP